MESEFLFTLSGPTFSLPHLRFFGFLDPHPLPRTRMKYNKSLTRRVNLVP